VVLSTELTTGHTPRIEENLVKVSRPFLINGGLPFAKNEARGFSIAFCVAESVHHV